MTVTLKRKYITHHAYIFRYLIGFSYLHLRCSKVGTKYQA